MDKLKKQILFVLLISILLCSVQAIAAADVSDTGVNDDVFDLSNDIETVQADEETEPPAPGNFAELQGEIDEADDTITLERDYVKANGESAIIINKSITIDGDNHYLDGSFITNGIIDTEDGIVDYIHHDGYYERIPYWPYMRWVEPYDEPVYGDTTITLKNIHFINSLGSAIDAYNYKLILINCTFEDNRATSSGDNQGAAIYIDGCNVSISDSTFKGNNATTGSAIYLAEGALDISKTTFLENRASSTSINIAQLDPEYPSPGQVVFHGFIGNFTGKDNLINGIFATSSDDISFTDVTYLGENGETVTTSDVPELTTREEGITVNVIIVQRGPGGRTINLTAITNSTGGYLITAAQAHLEEGEYTAYAIHYGDNYYTEIKSDNMDYFWSHMHNTKITNATVEGYAGDKVNVTFTVTTVVGNHHVQNGTVVVEINGVNYTAKVNRTTGKATVEITLPEEGGDFNVTYDGTGTKYYWNSTGNLKITINKPVDTAITVSPQNITVGDDETVSFAIDPTEVTGTVSVVIKDADGNTVYTNDSVAIEDAEFTVSAEFLPAGTYNVTVSFAGNKQYNPSEASETFTVSKKASTVTVNPKDIKVGDDETVTFTVTEDVTGTTVSVVIKDSNGNTVYENASVAIADGEFTVPADVLPAGTYNVTVSYEGDGVYNASEASKTFEVSKRDVIVEIVTDPVTGEQGTTATVTIKVTDKETGEAVTTGTVVYTINWEDKLGETHSITLGATLDENGQATQDVELSGEPGTYSATASYTDDSGKYNDGEAEGTAVVTESESDDNSTDDTPDDSTDDSTDDSSEETQGTASKSAAVETLATGNPIAMLVLVLLTLVSTISIRRQK